MRCFIAILFLLVSTTFITAEHNSEPSYGYYETRGDEIVLYNSVGSVHWYKPQFQIHFTLPEENDDGPDIELQVTGTCYIVPDTGRVLGTFLNFVIDSDYDDPDRYVDEEITVRLKTRIYRHTLEEHSENLRSFTLKWVPQNGDTGINYVNHENTINYLLEDLLNEGQATIEAKDDNANDFKFIIVSRPTGHQTHNVFDWVSRCYYSGKHPDVGQEEESSLNSSHLDSFLDTWSKDIQQDQIRVLAPTYKKLINLSDEQDQE